MNFPTFAELRPNDIITNKIADAHLAAYNFLKELDNYEFKDEKGDTTINLQVASSESLTAGLIFSTLVNIPYGGKYKYGSFSVYDTDAKILFNGINTTDVYTHKCASQMAVGILLNSNATFGIAVTGNAMPYQTDMNNMLQLGEVFIGLSCYVLEDNKIKILTKTIVHNMCIDEEIKERIRTCKLFYDNVENENTLKKIIETKIVDDENKKEIEKIKKMYDGYNEFEITSNVSNYIRYKTTEKSFEEAIIFLRDNKDKIIIPTFIETSKKSNLEKITKMNYQTNNNFPYKSNNNIIDVIERQKLEIILVNENATDDTRDNTETHINKLLYKQKYLKYKNKYIKYKKMLEKN